MKYLVLALLLVTSVASAHERPLYPERPPAKPPYSEQSRQRPLYPEPVWACKPFFRPVCRLLKRETR